MNYLMKKVKMIENKITKSVQGDKSIFLQTDLFIILAFIRLIDITLAFVIKSIYL